MQIFQDHSDTSPGPDTMSRAMNSSFIPAVTAIVENNETFTIKTFKLSTNLRECLLRRKCSAFIQTNTEHAMAFRYRLVWKAHRSESARSVETKLSIDILTMSSAKSFCVESGHEVDLRTCQWFARNRIWLSRSAYVNIFWRRHYDFTTFF